MPKSITKKTLNEEMVNILGIRARKGSRVEKVLSIYTKIDDEIDSHFKKVSYSPACKEGCSECCHDYFPISEIEFELILEEIKKWDKPSTDQLLENVKKQWNKMLKCNPAFIKTLEQDDGSFNGVFKSYALNPFRGKEYPCLFLNKHSQKCEIYSVRPIICRTYGTSYRDVLVDNNSSIIRRALIKILNLFGKNKKVCGKIENYKKARNWQADISKLDGDIDSVNMLIKKDTMIYLKPFPIIYYLYRAFFTDKTKFSINDYKHKFLESEHKYIEIVFERLGE